MSALSCGNVAGVKCAWYVVVPKGLCASSIKVRNGSIFFLSVVYQHRTVYFRLHITCIIFFFSVLAVWPFKSQLSQ